MHSRTTASAKILRLALALVASVPLTGCGETARVPVWDGATRSWDSVTVAVVNGEAILGGDLRLGPVNRIRAPTAGPEKGLPNPWFGSWEGGEVPYTVSPSFASHRALLDSVFRRWEEGTGIRFVPRARQASYVQISLSRDPSLCVTDVGSDVVTIEAQPFCIGHEIGHALGLYHEHQRADRDRFVEIDLRWWHSRSKRAQYAVIRGIRPCGPYDLGSVMHYDDDFIRMRPGYLLTRSDNVPSAGDRRAVAAIHAGASC